MWGLGLLSSLLFQGPVLLPAQLGIHEGPGNSFLLKGFPEGAEMDPCSKDQVQGEESSWTWRLALHPSSEAGLQR